MAKKTLFSTLLKRDLYDQLIYRLHAVKVAVQTDIPIKSDYREPGLSQMYRLLGNA